MKTYKVSFNWFGEGTKFIPDSDRKMLEEEYIKFYNLYAKGVNEQNLASIVNQYCELQYGTANWEDDRVRAEHTKAYTMVITMASACSYFPSKFGRYNVSFYIEPIDVVFTMKVEMDPEANLNFFLIPTEG